MKRYSPATPLDQSHVILRVPTRGLRRVVNDNHSRGRQCRLMLTQREVSPGKEEVKERTRAKARERTSGLRVGQPLIPKVWPSAKTTTCQEDAKANVAGRTTAQS
jgi:hypothetical protein